MSGTRDDARRTRTSTTSASSRRGGRDASGAMRLTTSTAAATCPSARRSSRCRWTCGSSSAASRTRRVLIVGKQDASSATPSPATVQKCARFFEADRSTASPSSDLLLLDEVRARRQPRGASSAAAQGQGRQGPSPPPSERYERRYFLGSHAQPPASNFLGAPASDVPWPPLGRRLHRASRRSPTIPGQQQSVRPQAECGSPLHAAFHGAASS